MARWIERTQARAAAAPRWLNASAAIVPFVVPIPFTVGAWGPYGAILDGLHDVVGDVDYVHLLAYLLCVVPLVLIGGALVQLVGHRRLTRSNE